MILKGVAAGWSGSQNAFRRSRAPGNGLPCGGMRWRIPGHAPGPAAVQVPCLMGVGVRAAQDLLLDAGFLPVVSGPGSAAGAGSGRVCRQVPTAGRWAAPGTRVRIWVDPGPGTPGGGSDEGPDGGGGGGGGMRRTRPPGPKLPTGTK